MKTSNHLTGLTPTRPRSPALVLGALAVLLAASVAVAAPPGGRGGGKNGGGGGDTGSGGYQPEMHLLWRVPLGAAYSQVRPAVAPDGTIYVVDVARNLFAVAPTGTVKWQIPNAGDKGVDVGPDGTIYTGTEDWIKAFNPEDGSLKWEFTQDPRAFILLDVAVGPDGNVYGVASSGMGVFSLDPDGNERWRTPESYNRPNVIRTEIEFGPTSDGGDYQLYFAANAHTRAVRLSDGEPVFTAATTYQPKTSPLDGSWHWPESAYTPAGELLWAFSFPAAFASSTPSIGNDGTHYTINQFDALFAIGPAGNQLWSAALDEMATQVDVDPIDSLLVLNAGGTQTHPAAVRAVSARNGSPLWRVEFPSEGDLSQFVDTDAAFSPTGDTVYVITGTNGGNANLNAIATDPSIPSASTVLRAADVVLNARSARRSVSFAGIVTVMDENRATVSGATVAVVWTLPDGTTQVQSADTGGGGQASFKISGPGGLYRLTVTEISKPSYQFDPQHSILGAAKAWN